MPPVRGVGRPRGRGRGRGNGRGGPHHEERVHEEREATPPPPPPERHIEELFLRQNPPTFDGLGDPSIAETWVRAIERIFNFFRCTDEERMTCVSFQLTGSADFWWEARRKTMTPEQLEAVTWEQFKTGIYDKYIPKSYRKKKESEFYNLKQGRMSVTEYDRTFCDMSRYAPEQVDIDEKMAEKFCAGLRHEIRMALASLGGLSYPESLSRALDIEAAMPGEKLTATPAPPLTQSPPQSHHLKGKRKWDHKNGGQTEKKPWQGQPRSHDIEKTATGQTENYQQKFPPCAKCYKMHNEICRAGTNCCYKCGQQGHYANKCPVKADMKLDNDQTQRLHAIKAQPLTQVPPPPPPPAQNQQQPRLTRKHQQYTRTYEMNKGLPKDNQGNSSGIRKSIHTPMVKF